MRTKAAIALVSALLLAGPASGQGRGYSNDPASAPSGAYTLDPRHASLTAKVRHLGFSRFVMRFEAFDATIDYDSREPERSQVRASVDVGSVRTPLAEFNAVIADSYLGGGGQPQATFVSRALVQTSPAEGLMSGDLTLRGVTRPVELKVVFNGTGPGLGGTPTMGLSATGTVSRREFGVAPGVPEFIASDEVEIEIEAEFKRQ
jgi:polyisoprenoid-binding protein YceI